MGSVSDLVAALAFLGLTRVWDAREEDRKSRQEEAFVPFNLSHYAVGTSDPPPGKEPIKMLDPTLYRMVAQAQQEDAWREAERLRLLALLPQNRWSLSRRAAGHLGTLLLSLGTWLKQFEQPHRALEEQI